MVLEEHLNISIWLMLTLLEQRGWTWTLPRIAWSHGDFCLHYKILKIFPRIPYILLFKLLILIQFFTWTADSVISGFYLLLACKDWAHVAG